LCIGLRYYLPVGLKESRNKLHTSSWLNTGVVFGVKRETLILLLSFYVCLRLDLGFVCKFVGSFRIGMFSLVGCNRLSMRC